MTENPPQSAKGFWKRPATWCGAEVAVYRLVAGCSGRVRGHILGTRPGQVLERAPTCCEARLRSNLYEQADR